MWAQLIKTRLKNGNEAGLQQLFQQLRDAEHADSGLLRTLAMRDQHDPNSLLMLVVFESEEKARARENDPRRADTLVAARATMAEVFDGDSRPPLAPSLPSASQVADQQVLARSEGVEPPTF